jgi:Protein of unknown function (DUF2778)
MWSFKQSTGELFNGSGEVVATGYAGGNCGNNPDGVNNPSAQDQHSVGPLPQGIYMMTGVSETSHVGPYAIILSPSSDNEMFGRGDFRIHGDRTNGPAKSASEGCIIMPRAIREKIWESGERLLEVIA